MFELMHCTFYLFFFFIQDICYANYKELIKKKLITKFQTTVITDRRRDKGKSITYLLLSTFHNYIRHSQKTAAQLLKSGLFYK